MHARSLVLGLSLLVAACAAPSAAPIAPPRSSAPTAAPERTPALQALVDAARGEGQLTLVGSDGVLGGSRGARELAERFNRLYGLQLNVVYTPGANMAEGMVRLVQETQADRPAFTDVIVAAGNQMLTMIRANALTPVDWATWAPNVQDARLLGPDGTTVAAQTSVAVITYNSQRVAPAEVPHSLEDLLKPQYKGRIASTPYAAHFNTLAAPMLWGSTRALDYMKAFADQTAGLIRCAELERVISGEYDLFALDCSQNVALRSRLQGAPIDFVIPADAPILGGFYVAVPRKAAHPNAAKLWINFLMSRETQDFLFENDYMDQRYLPGSRTAALIEQYEAAGLTFVATDVAFYQRNDEQELDRVLAEQQRLLRKQ